MEVAGCEPGWRPAGRGRVRVVLSREPSRACVPRTPAQRPSRGSRHPLTAPTTHADAAPEPAALAAARRLHAHLGARHLHDGRLSGADQGVRWNIRVGAS